MWVFCTGLKLSSKLKVMSSLQYIRERIFCMPYPSLAVFCRPVQTSSIHHIQEGCLIIWLVAIFMRKRILLLGWGMARKTEGRMKHSCHFFLYNYKMLQIQPHQHPFLTWQKYFIGKEMGRPVLHGLVCDLCNSRPSEDVSVHVVMSVSLWPWTSTFVLFPVSFFPCQRVMVNLRPTSSTKMNMWSVVPASRSMAL